MDQFFAQDVGTLIGDKNKITCKRMLLSKKLCSEVDNRTPQKESRRELLKRVAAGAANQADDLLEVANQRMESCPVVPDRKLLARLLLIKEARDMMGGGILYDRILLNQRENFM
ncbi:Hypothetical predicted protein [Olea europaea subsp. europaea]|uniref:Uncharacterized protein n=1 Tax=Olea europaea subsp. europaea TaxID=158383 RepID=A0A8S0QCG6_OLEEU|nr:Hypothetical predicted protein [Olea europaea subsp. europaea]